MSKPVNPELKAGTLHYNKSSKPFIITCYVKWDKIAVLFLNTGHQRFATAQNIVSGALIDKMNPTICGIGYLGEGEHRAKKGKKQTHEYIVWKHMLSRCYDRKTQKRTPAYIGCSVVEEWHNFQTFAAWITEKYTEGYEIDKDLTILGNKVYGPKTCCMVPRRINTLLLHRGDGGIYPRGVSLCKVSGKYVARVNRSDTRDYLGEFETAELAFFAYKEAKERHIKEMAIKHRSGISEAVYINLINYEIVP